jgi:hypothetical protein
MGKFITIVQRLLVIIMVAGIISTEPVAAQGTSLDSFETITGWEAIASTGSWASIVQDEGFEAKGIRLDFDLSPGGFIILRKSFAVDLPDNYAFHFKMKAKAPVNNFEFKLIDDSGQNVWWHNQKDFEFPSDWHDMVVKKRHMQFAWGPNGNDLKQVGAIEFAISPGAGGKGSIWLDDLRFEERDPVLPYTLTPQTQASSEAADYGAAMVLDPDPNSRWLSGNEEEAQWLQVDFLKVREYGGLVIDWDEEDYATAYQVEISEDGQDWRGMYAVAGGNGGRDYIYLPDTESRYLRLLFQRSSRGQGYGVRTLTVKPYEFSASINQFFEAIARDNGTGVFPKYLYGQQSYWTVVGVDGDSKEGLLNEEGMLEVDKGAFSIEPFLYADGELISWNDVTTQQELERGYLPIPSVTWRNHHYLFKITAFAAGKPGESILYARYRLENLLDTPQELSLFLAMRPFQVNPPWQSLNMAGGAAPIREFGYDNHSVWVNQEKRVISLTLPNRFGAVAFDRGSITDYLRRGQVPETARVTDHFGHASGALEYAFELPPHAVREVYLAIPFHDPKSPAARELAAGDGSSVFYRQLNETTRAWEERLNRVEVQLPNEAQAIADTLKSTLAYIFINRNGPALQPGSRTYARSWIRDGALTSTALLQMGYTEEVRDFIRWYAQFQFPDGKVPCCVDRRGPDGVAENDSNGEFIYVLAEYYRFTHDLDFLREMWPQVMRAVEYIDFLRRQRTTEEYKQGDKAAFYGLVPESISHEGYASHPVHSYWDDFFVLRGLKDAAGIAEALGQSEHAKKYAELRGAFQDDLYASLARAIERHNVGYLPASVELGDFDPTSTAIAIDPIDELDNLPRRALKTTFDDYFKYFLGRRDGGLSWEAYTPYELRIVTALNRMGQRDRALETLAFFMGDRRPKAWNQWGEIVWREPGVPRFIGDMPHTWVGSEFIRAIRSLFVYEHAEDQALVLASGLHADWVRSEEGVSVKGLPTHYGKLNYSLRPEDGTGLRLSLSGDMKLPPGGIVVRPPLPAPLKEVTVGGKAIDTFDGESAIIHEFPAEVTLRY